LLPGTQRAGDNLEIDTVVGEMAAFGPGLMTLASLTDDGISESRAR
jgi:hypothetical protein